MTSFEARGRGLQFLGGLLLFNRFVARGSALFVELGAHGAVELLLKDGLRLNRLKLGLEVFGSECAGIASAAGIGQVEAHLVDFVAFAAPIAFAAAILLHLCWILSGMARFGKISRKMLFLSSRAVSKTGMVTVSVLVRASHIVQRGLNEEV